MFHQIDSVHTLTLHNYIEKATQNIQLKVKVVYTTLFFFNQQVILIILNSVGIFF